MFSPLFLRELLSVLIIFLHFLGLGYRTISGAERLRVISTLGLRPNHEDVWGVEIKLCPVLSSELRRGQFDAPLSLERYSFAGRL